MNKKILLSLLSVSILAIIIIACEKDAKPDNKPVPPPVVTKSFVEEFDTVANLARKGWVIQNNSQPYGPSAWRQGLYESGSKLAWITDFVGFPAYSAVYSPNEFVSCDLSAGTGAATLSVWLITPPIPLKNGDQLSFYTRTAGNFIDRMQVRANYINASTNVGINSSDVGDFTTLLIDINAGMTLPGYPATWTKYTYTVAGAPTSLVNGRFAFRYYVTNAGPGGANSDMIGVDKLEFISK